MICFVKKNPENFAVLTFIMYHITLNGRIYIYTVFKD